jgi:uroporphyrinogen decarboxylase
MTPKERFETALKMEMPDRVPVFYQHLGGARWVLSSVGKTIHEGFSDPDIFAEICLETRRLFGYDNVMAGWGDILVEAHALGTEWRFPEKDYYPRPSKYAVQNPEDADMLRVVDPMEDEFWSVPLKAAEILQEKIGKEVPVVGCIDSPMVIGSELRGYENLLMDTVMRPDLANKMLKVITESSKIYGNRLAEIGVGTIFVENGTAGAEQTSPELCERFDMRHLRNELEHFKKLGLMTILHNCSARPYIELESALKPNAIHFNISAVDLEKTFGSLRGTCCSIAGIDHQKLMFKGSADEVEAEVRKTIERYGHRPGLIIGPGCEMPFKTPIENIRRLREAAEKYGKY